MYYYINFLFCCAYWHLQSFWVLYLYHPIYCVGHIIFLVTMLISQMYTIFCCCMLFHTPIKILRNIFFLLRIKAKNCILKILSIQHFVSKIYSCENHEFFGSKLDAFLSIWMKIIYGFSLMSFRISP